MRERAPEKKVEIMTRREAARVNKKGKKNPKQRRAGKG